MRTREPSPTPGGNADVDGARVAVVLERQPPRRAVIRVLERQLDLVLDVAPWPLARADRAARRRVPRRRAADRRRRTW